MKIITDITEYSSSEPTSLALGTFDGFHIGHREVLRKAASDINATPGVFTFEQSPAGIITGNMVYAITTQSLKQQLAREMGFELFVTPNFQSIRDMQPQEFVNMLKEQFNAVRLCCGFNFKFGKNGDGNAAMLTQLCKPLDIEVCIIPPVAEDGLPVSSSRIRESIAAGDMKTVNRLLGRNFGFDFSIIEGDHRGRTMSIPTINQRMPQNFVSPKYGVYASRVLIDGKFYKSVSNIGIRPTVGSEYARCETFILDYQGELYGENIYVELIEYLRPERRFDSLDELKNVINSDIESVRNMQY